MAKLRKVQITVTERARRKAEKKAEKARKIGNRSEAKIKAKASASEIRYQKGLNEIRRYVDAQKRRTKKAELKAGEQQASRISKQARLVALRSSMTLEWLVLIRFTRGAYQISVARPSEDVDKLGFTIWRDHSGSVAFGKESRACRKVRADLPALRFGEAENLATNIRRKFALNPSSRKVSRRQRRRG